MGPAVLIAIDVLLLYALLGPLVLFAVFVLFDHLSLADRTGTPGTGDTKDPALWSLQETIDFLDRA
jgi:hypothetical protein